MAVVQISKIQIRRGRKKTDTGMPQLASGELAWAIDTQELFVGNGSVSEGAPYVGNTRVLTEHDNLLELLRQYQYKALDTSVQTGTDPNFPIKRTLQDRLDEGSVNALSFGIVPIPYPAGETISTQTQRIKHALTQIAGKATLEFEPGVYQFNDKIEVFSNTILKGAGKGRTIFEFLIVGSNISTAIQTIPNSSYISISGVTVKLPIDSIGLGIDNTTASTFKSIEFTYGTGVPVLGSTENITGIVITQNSASSTLTSQNLFEDVDFRGLTYAVDSSGEVRYNFFKNCVFRNLFQGVRLGIDTLATYNTITDSVFDTILEQAITIKGYGNRSRGNTFINVGNNNGGTNATHSIIKFLTPGNSSYQDYFERTSQLTTADLTLDYIPEIEGPVYREEVFTNVISLPNTLVPTEIIRLPISDSTSLEVNYIFTSSTFQQVRKGTIHLVVDKLTDSLQLVDDYEYSGPDLGEDAIIFTAEVKVPNGSSTVKSVVISYINQNVTVDTNSFTYTFTITS